MISNVECKFLSIKNIGVFRRCFISADYITSLLTIDNANLVFVINCLKIKKIIIIILFHLIERNCVSTKGERSFLLSCNDISDIA